MRVDKPCHLVVNEADSIVYSRVGRRLNRVGFRVDSDPGMSPSGKIANTTYF